MSCERVIAVKGPRLWNMLPKDLTLADSLESFLKTNLDRLLLSFRDTPPISGDETHIPNSLLVTMEKREQNVARRTTAEYDGLVTCESLTLPAQRYSKVPKKA